jgi:hypothetical protein
MEQKVGRSHSSVMDKGQHQGSLCQDHTISINKLRCRLTSAADSRNPMAYHTTYEFLKQRTEKGFNIAVTPINTHDQGGIQSLLHDKART